MFCERSEPVVVVIIPNSPHIAGRYCRYFTETATTAYTGAWNHRPLRAIPVLHKRIGWLSRFDIIPNSPHIVGRYCCYCTEATVQTGIGTGNHGPSSNER